MGVKNKILTIYLALVVIILLINLPALLTQKAHYFLKQPDVQSEEQEEAKTKVEENKKVKTEVPKINTTVTKINTEVTKINVKQLSTDIKQKPVIDAVLEEKPIQSESSGVEVQSFIEWKQDVRKKLSWFDSFRVVTIFTAMDQREKIKLKDMTTGDFTPERKVEIMAFLRKNLSPGDWETLEELGQKYRLLE